ncbi:MAG: hypothetical protein IPP48_16375 [Chitinophagaceae bacterium]|nr:hypothetical protein [Chitinophagaceae bacterium]
MKKLLILSAALFFTYQSVAQNVGIGTLTPNASALLDVSATDKGLLIPRMSKTQRTAIAAPANGLLVFQNAPDSIGFYYYNSGSWVWLQNASGAGSGWSTTGNAGTDTIVNFIGTLDNMPLILKSNGMKIGGVDAATTYNVSLGAGANNLKSAGLANVSIGAYSLSNHLNGNNNVAIGNVSMLYNKYGEHNIAIGGSAMPIDTCRLWQYSYWWRFTLL